MVKPIVPTMGAKIVNVGDQLYGIGLTLILDRRSLFTREISLVPVGSDLVVEFVDNRFERMSFPTNCCRRERICKTS